MLIDGKRYILLFICLLSVSFFGGSAANAAENTIGVIMTGDIPYYNEMHNAFMARLTREGMAARTEIVLQKPYPDGISLSNAARKLIATEVDVIVAYGSAAAAAVINEKSRIPVVYAGVYEPFMQKLKSRNSTGAQVKLSLSSLLRYLRGLTRISNLGIVYSSNEEDSVFQFLEVSKMAGQLGIQFEGINLKRHQDAKARLSGKKKDAILLTGSAVAHMALPAVSEFAREQKIPVVSFMLSRDPRAVITLATSPAEQGEKAAEKALRIMEGVSPDKIRVDTAQDVELVFNFKEATSMGWKLPMDLVTEATRLIK